MKTKFCIPCNWDFTLLESLKPSLTHYVYGKLSSDIVGGGRPFYKLPKPTKDFIYNYVSEVRSKGVNFNYLLNSSCTGNKEFTKNGHKAIIDLITWVSDIGANYITVASPYIAELVKKNVPSIKLAVSKMAFVSDASQAKIWENIGASEITINPDLNRNFKKLELLKKATQCHLTLLVNEACLYRCPYVYYHVNSDSHASQNASTKPYICYSRLLCEKIFISNPQEIIKSTFIRPEDLHFYEEIGIRKFKLVGRTRPTSWITLALNAYCQRSYNGNLAEILGTFSLHREIPRRKKQSIRFNKIKNLKGLEQLRKTELFRLNIYIDNRKLDNFLKFFKDFDCENNSCMDCGYCKKYADKAVFIDKKENARVSKNLNMLIQWIKEGKAAKA
jgi:collagenase-like PrtC family protease